MDWLNDKESLTEWIRRFRPVILMALLGILLMILPVKREEEPVTMPDPLPAEESLEKSLDRILSLVDGAGEVDVLLTEEAGAQTLYQWDEDITSEDIRRETVIISGESRLEGGLVRQILPPTYRGAVVVCRGADDPGVRLALVEAVKSVTGLSSDRIIVLARE